jgi:hypothetical protein
MGSTRQSPVRDNHTIPMMSMPRRQVPILIVARFPIQIVAQHRTFADELIHALPHD